MEFAGLVAQRKRLGRQLEEAILRVVRHGQFVLGPEVSQLEDALAEYTSVEAVTCASGTDALTLALLALGVTGDCAVVVPSFTFSATAEAVRLAGATPVLADVDRGTGLVTPVAVAAAASAAERSDLVVRAVIVVDLFGQPVDCVALEEIANTSGAAIIADAAHSFGATLDGRRVGGLARVTATSFFPAKPLGCYGDGGAVFTPDVDLAKLLRSLRAHGRGESKFESVRLGMNSRLDTVQAAVLLEKLRIFDDELARRRAVAAEYVEQLTGVVGFLGVSGRCESAWAQFVIVAERRDEVRRSLEEAGCPTGIFYYPPLHKQRAYARSPRSDDLSSSEWLADHVLSLPMHPYLSGAEVRRICQIVRSRCESDGT